MLTLLTPFRLLNFCLNSSLDFSHLTFLYVLIYVALLKNIFNLTFYYSTHHIFCRKCIFQLQLLFSKISLNCTSYIEIPLVLPQDCSGQQSCVSRLQIPLQPTDHNIARPIKWAYLLLWFAIQSFQLGVVFSLASVSRPASAFRLQELIQQADSITLNVSLLNSNSTHSNLENIRLY